MPSFQTVRLARGRHRSPREGVCVAELASMLAAEPFSDHPSCACPAVTAFLRGYNDRLDGVRRQDLYGLASALVGSRRSEAVTTDRAQRLLDLAWRHRLRVGPVSRYPDVVRPTRFEACAAAGDHLGRCARQSDAVHREVVAFVAAMLDEPLPPQRDQGNALAGRDAEARPVPAPPAPMPAPAARS